MKIKLEKTKSFWAYIVGGILGICVGIFLLPAWSGVDVFFNSWGAFSVNIMIGGLLLAYILLYLVKRIKRYANTTAQVVAIVELVLMAVLAIVCAISSFIDMGRLGDPCQVFGIALWIRGASGVYTGYYCDSNIVKAAEEEKKAKKNGTEIKKTQKELDTSEEPKGRVDDFTVWRLTLAIALISIGTYLFIKPAFEASHLQWVFSCAIIGVSFFFIIFGFALKPSKLKVDELSPDGKKEKKAEGKKKTEAKVDGEKKDSLDQGDKDTTLDSEKQKSLEGGKVNIKLDGSANAMTKTAAYDAVKEEKTENLPALTEK